MIINPYIFGGFDPDAQAFITAANITDNTQKTAINQLVLDLKAYNIWSKMKAIYPFVGGSASTHKFNLKDPRDLDAAFRLVFNGGWTHSSTGALPNGTNAYADTFLTPSVSLLLNNSHISSYSRTSTANTNDGLIGAYTAQVPNDFGLRILKVGSNYYAENNNIFTNAAFTYSNHNGYYINSRILSTTYKTYRNNSIISTKSINSNGLAINKILLGANSDGALITYYSIREQAFATIGDGLTDTDATNLYIATETFQTTLGRNVGVPIVSDPDAQAFLFAAQITNTTEANAVNQLVISLKAQGLWSKMKAIYPFVGGTASTHKFNLKDPRDLDAAFRLVFNGGWTHSSNGAQPNGTNGYADTYFNLFTNFNLNSGGTSIYKNLFINGGSDIVSYVNANTAYYNAGYSSSANAIAFSLSSSPLSYSDSGGVGLYISNALNGTTKGYKNNILKLTTTTAGAIPNVNSQIGKNTFGNIEFSNSRYCFISYHNGLTDTDATNLYNTVQTFQTSLSRQV